ncbi:MAG: 16S rRNA (cytidine(1402)-2'-O)-methyltransferase [Lachnospiraceae bacterium]|nr:16S rRNA (cytidine(1402)-2'-O)-methyltransferase [Lachnospiraceae bacterium]
MPGKLYLCATPIGNLKDMPPRAVEILKSADLIAAEDTRNSIKLLNHFDIRTPMTAYHEYNRFDKAEELVKKILDEMTVACITDAGTPGISDPGEVLAAKCIEAGIEVSTVPGPSACIAALVISGLPTRRFRFEAFLPTEKKERQEILENLKDDAATLIFYEAPHRLVKTLSELYTALGDRRVSVCKELTKVHESVLRTTLSGAIVYFGKEEPRGEYVLVVEGRTIAELAEEAQQAWQEMSVEEHLQRYLSSGMDRMEAMKQVAKDRGLSKRDVYRELNKN